MLVAGQVAVLGLERDKLMFDQVGQVFLDGRASILVSLRLGRLLRLQTVLTDPEAVLVGDHFRCIRPDVSLLGAEVKRLFKLICNVVYGYASESFLCERLA